MYDINFIIMYAIRNVFDLFCWGCWMGFGVGFGKNRVVGHES